MSRPQKIIAAVAGVGLVGLAYACFTSYKLKKNAREPTEKVDKVTDESREKTHKSKKEIKTQKDTTEYNLLLEYDVSALEGHFKQRRWEVFNRTSKVLFLVLPYMCRLLIWEYYIRRKIRDHEGLQQRYAVELRELLTKLGPCFIKFGQCVSSRPDLLPFSFMLELQKLTDSVPSYPTEKALLLIESELGNSIEDIFQDFNQTEPPIAAASLGQVYKLQLRDEGAMVAVKVQRPDMLHEVLTDIHIVRKLAKLVDYIQSKTSNQKPFNLSLVDRFAGQTIKELDYINEASNQRRFKEELEPRMNNQIYVPKVYTKYTTRKVLVTQWIEGEQLARSPKDVINRLIPVAVECYLVMIFEIAYFHADPHPGNILVSTDGKLALIDFGLCEGVPPEDTIIMTLTIVHIMQSNVAALIEDMVMLNFLPPDVNRETLMPALQDVFNTAQLSKNEVDSKEQNKGENNKSTHQTRVHFADLSIELNKVFLKYPFVVPDYFALITRTLILLEGIGLTGDPSFDLFQAAYPFSRKRAEELFGVDGLEQMGDEALNKKKDR